MRPLDYNLKNVPLRAREKHFDISKPFILVVASDVIYFAGLAPDGIDVLGVKDVGSNHILVQAPNGEELHLKTAPAMCLGMFAFQDESIKMLEAVHERLSFWGGSALPAPLRLLADDPSTIFMASLVARLSAKLLAFTKLTTQLSAEMCRLREAHEDSLNSFAEAEAFLSSNGKQPCLITFENLPDEGSNLSGQSKEISQLLPVSTYGLSVIQILLTADATDERIGGLSITLSTHEDKKLHQVWHIPREDLECGWVTLSVVRGLSGIQRTPVLKIEPLGRLGVLPPLALGKFQAIGAFRPQIIELSHSSEAADRSLALRTWSGLPGVRPPGFDFNGNGASRVLQLAVPPAMLANIYHVKSAWDPDFEAVKYLTAERELLCHPPPQGLTCGEFLYPLQFNQPFRISAHVAVRHRSANPTEFAIVVADPNVWKERIAAGEDMSNRKGVAFSGWHKVAADTEQFISLDISEPHQYERHAFLVTRIADGLENAFGWARFFDLRITLLDNLEADEGNRHLRRAGTAPTPLDILNKDSFTDELLGDVENCLNLEGASGPLVAYDKPQKGILCHPRDHGITLAKLGNFVVDGPGRIHATAMIMNALSEPVEFCLVATSLNVSEIVGLIDGVNQPEPFGRFSSSGWIEVSHDDDKIIHADASSLTNTQIGLYLATRMTKASVSSAYAWAFFTNFGVEPLDEAIDVSAILLS